MRYVIDLPDPRDATNAWIEVASFDTKREAIKWAKENLGADKDGKITIISEFDEDE
jgi:hypothetical protein